MAATVPDTHISKADHSDTHRICPPFGGHAPERRNSGDVTPGAVELAPLGRGIHAE